MSFALSLLCSLVAYMVKNLPAVQETWVWCLNQEDPPSGLVTDKGRRLFIHCVIIYTSRALDTIQTSIHRGLRNYDAVTAAVAQSLSCVWLFVTLKTIACQALSMRFPRQEYWSGLPFPPPGDLPIPGTELTYPLSPALGGEFFTTEPPGKFQLTSKVNLKILTVLNRQQGRFGVE